MLDVLSNGPTQSLWASAASGNWSNPANWTAGVPNSIGAAVTINAPTAPLTVTLDIPLTLGTLTLGNSNSSSVGYTLSGSGANTLTLNNSGRGATISVTNGSHAINAAVVLADNLVVSGSGTLAFGSAGITNNGGGYSLTMNGTGGTLILGGSNTYSGGTILNAGILQAGNNSPGSEHAALAVNGGTLDVHGYNVTSARSAGRELSTIFPAAAL